MTPNELTAATTSATSSIGFVNVLLTATTRLPT
jgi:hypothetical protein